VDVVMGIYVRGMQAGAAESLHLGVPLDFDLRGSGTSQLAAVGGKCAVFRQQRRNKFGRRTRRTSRQLQVNSSAPAKRGGVALKKVGAIRRTHHRRCGPGQSSLHDFQYSQADCFSETEIVSIHDQNSQADISKPGIPPGNGNQWAEAFRRAAE
jgi:hypothetical protein